MTTVTEKKKPPIFVAPFVVECDHPRNCDVVLQSIPGCRLRTRMKPTTESVVTRRQENLEPHIRTHVSGESNTAPPLLPGMLLSVNPAELTVVITDPLKDDEKAQQRVKRYVQETRGVKVDGSLIVQEERTERLDEDRMKTLCRELICLIVAEEIRVVEGPTPVIDEVDDLPGDYLLNPGTTDYNQPRYEKDYDSWRRRMSNLSFEV